MCVTRHGTVLFVGKIGVMISSNLKGGKMRATINATIFALIFFAHGALADLGEGGAAVFYPVGGGDTSQMACSIWPQSSFCLDYGYIAGSNGSDGNGPGGDSGGGSGDSGGPGAGDGPGDSGNGGCDGPGGHGGNGPGNGNGNSGNPGNGGGNTGGSGPGTGNGGSNNGQGGSAGNGGGGSGNGK